MKYEEKPTGSIVLRWHADLPSSYSTSAYRSSETVVRRTLEAEGFEYGNEESWLPAANNTAKIMPIQTLSEIFRIVFSSTEKQRCASEFQMKQADLIMFDDGSKRCLALFN